MSINDTLHAPNCSLIISNLVEGAITTGHIDTTNDSINSTTILKTDRCYTWIVSHHSMRTAFEKKIALGFVPPRRLKHLRQLSHLWWGNGTCFPPLQPWRREFDAANVISLQSPRTLADLELWSKDGRYNRTTCNSFMILLKQRRAGEISAAAAARRFLRRGATGVGLQFSLRQQLRVEGGSPSLQVAANEWRKNF